MKHHRLLLIVYGPKADADKSGPMMWVGVLLLFVSLCFDGATGAYEDELMQTGHLGPFELMYSTSLLTPPSASSFTFYRSSSSSFSSSSHTYPPHQSHRFRKLIRPLMIPHQRNSPTHPRSHVSISSLIPFVVNLFVPSSPRRFLCFVSGITYSSER